MVVACPRVNLLEFLGQANLRQVGQECPTHTSSARVRLILRYE